ncbi:family 16 glycosylhydrolase [Methanooceanicella nereidis]|nr:family 16 glycosylhydrolase [Methanocella sp. CWC-04]
MGGNVWSSATARPFLNLSGSDLVPIDNTIFSCDLMSLKIKSPEMLYDYVLYDNFTSLDSKTWTISSYTPDSDFLKTTFTRPNVWGSNGKLVLRSCISDRTGGEIKSNDLFYHGKYRAAIMVDQTPGTFLTFYSYLWPSKSNRHNEIDIELLKNDHGGTTAMFTTWYNYKKTQKLYDLPFDPGADYHIYGYDWYGDRVEFYIDGDLIWTSFTDLPQDPMYVYFNNWVGKNVPDGYGNRVNIEYVDWVTIEDL